MSPVFCAKALLCEKMWKFSTFGTLGTNYVRKKLFSGAQFCGTPLFPPSPAHSHGAPQTSLRLLNKTEEVHLQVHSATFNLSIFCRNIFFSAKVKMGP